MIILAGIIAYLLGSIPFAYIIGEKFFGIDVRTLGSGNVGSTNALRNFGKKAGIATLILDFLKGYVAVLIGSKLAGEKGINIALLMVVLGHMYSIFLNFKSGKGVATSAGAMLFINPKLFLILVAIFILTILVSRMVSLGSILAAASAIILGYFFYGFTPIYYVIAIVCIMIIYKHRTNIKRIKNGNESKVF